MNTPPKPLNMTKAVAPYQENTAFEVVYDNENKSNTNADILESRCTSTKTQLAKLLLLLRQGPQTTYTLRKHGIAQCAARIFHLRALGHVITTEKVSAVDSDGYEHARVARYCLVKEVR